MNVGAICAYLRDDTLNMLVTAYNIQLERILLRPPMIIR